MSPIEIRLMQRRRITASGCWEWSGAIGLNGYASTGDGARNKRKYVHRLAHEFWIGPIPDGKEIDHLCRNRRCFNPQHLEAVTRSENVRRGIGPDILRALCASKTHCKHGHPFDAANTRLRPTGGRDCRACARNKQRQYRKDRRNVAD